MDDKSVIPVEVMVEKVRAAAAARGDPHFVINARHSLSYQSGSGSH
jgi:2-methylisocitrate lyase-like PEP mutase family enzyme